MSEPVTDNDATFRGQPTIPPTEIGAAARSGDRIVHDTVNLIESTLPLPHLT